MKKFWNWNNRPRNASGGDPEERVLRLSGPIAEESWWDDDVTPKIFREELESGKGPVTVWINSPGGDCFAAAQIYNMLREYPGRVTVKIDSLAASAASVIAMAGDTVLISPTGMLMVHNPSTLAWGNRDDMQKAIDILDSVRESIVNAYQIKTGLTHSRLVQLMDDETWMDAKQAIQLRFCDAMLERSADPDEEDPDEENPEEEPEEEPGEPEEDPDEEPEENPDKKQRNDAVLPHMFAAAAYTRRIINKLTAEVPRRDPEPAEPAGGVRVDDLMERLRRYKDNF